MNDAELDDSIAVTVVTWVLYLGWLSMLAGVALWFGVEPLPSVQEQVPGPLGTVAALAVGVAFILVSRQIYDHLRARYKGTDVAESVPEPEPEAPPPTKRKRKKRKKKKKR